MIFQEIPKRKLHHTCMQSKKYDPGKRKFMLQKNKQKKI